MAKSSLEKALRRFSETGVEVDEVNGYRIFLTNYLTQRVFERDRAMILDTLEGASVVAIEGDSREMTFNDHPENAVISEVFNKADTDDIDYRWFSNPVEMDDPPADEFGLIQPLYIVLGFISDYLGVGNDRALKKYCRDMFQNPIAIGHDRDAILTHWRRNRLREEDLSLVSESLNFFMNSITFQFDNNAFLEGLMNDYEPEEVAIVCSKYMHPFVRTYLANGDSSADWAYHLEDRRFLELYGAENVNRIRDVYRQISDALGKDYSLELRGIELGEDYCIPEMGQVIEFQRRETRD